MAADGRPRVQAPRGRALAPRASAPGQARAETRRRRSRSDLRRRRMQTLGAAMQLARQRRSVQQLQRLQRRRRCRSRRHHLFAVRAARGPVISGSAATSAARVRSGGGTACELDQRDVEACVAAPSRQTPVTALTASTNCSAVSRRLAGPRKTYGSSAAGDVDGHALIRVRRQDQRHRALQVVAVRDQILGQPVEQVRMPRRPVPCRRPARPARGP